MNEVYDETPAIIVSTANPFKFPQSVYEAVSQSKEDDANKAIKKLSAYTGAEVPEGIKNLNEKEVLHNMVVSKSDIESAILSVLGGN